MLIHQLGSISVPIEKSFHASVSLGEAPSSSGYVKYNYQDVCHLGWKTHRNN